MGSHDGVQFVAEHIDSASTFDKWQAFARRELAIARQPDGKKWFDSNHSGLSAFQDVLDHMRVDDSNVDTWVVYVVGAHDDHEIEMYVSVSTERGVPFTCHMGIQKSYQYARAHGVDGFRPRLSMLLHAFAAQSMLTRYGDEKVYMITRPVYGMKNIMQKALGDRVSVGDTWNDAMQQLYGRDETYANYSEEQVAPVSVDLAKHRRRTDSPIVVLFDLESREWTFDLLDPTRKRVIWSYSENPKANDAIPLFDFETPRTVFEHKWFFHHPNAGWGPLMNNYAVVELHDLAALFR